ncbi:MAG TPA: LacI family DNA-binding transcriptional regulator [Opitutaceae bacterium]|nr:LacI family DNA-binding transcriptional regulator [Opitutaceae bacterium]
MKPVTQRDVALAARVSQNTVSLALRGDPRLPAATRDRIQQAATKLGYRPNPLVAALMSAVRQRKGRAAGVVAIVLAGPARGRVGEHPSLQRALAGSREHAAQRGYRVEEFWMQDQRLSPARLQSMLLARGIRGVVLHPDEENPVPPALDWTRFASAVLAVLDPHLGRFHCASSQAFRNVEIAVMQLRQRGYRRIGLAVPQRYDLMVDRLYSGAFAALPDVAPRQALLRLFSGTEWNRDTFLGWFAKARPDVVLTRTTDVRGWLESAGVSIGREIGLVHLGWHTGLKGWAGVDLQAEAMGAAAVDLVIEQLNSNSFGLPEVPKMVLIAGRWRDGPSIESNRKL